MYVELCIGDLRNRGQVIPHKQLSKYITGHRGDQLYRSVYLYPDAGQAYAQEHGSLKGYRGEHIVDWIVLDVDKGGQTDEKTLRIAQSIAYELMDDYGLTDEHFLPYFSGSGYHLLIHADVFDIAPSPDVPYLVKKTVQALFPQVDHSVTNRGSIYRLPHSLNPKTGLYKIPLMVNELMESTPDQIQQLAKTPRWDFDYTSLHLHGEGELHAYLVTEAPERKALTTVRENTNVVPCVQRMYNKGPVQGHRHRTMLRICSHFKRHGIPVTAARAALDRWLDDDPSGDPILPDEVDRIVSNVYSKPYKYGCNDAYMEQHCSSQCIYFSRKDYNVEVYSVDDMQQELEERLHTDYSGRAIDLAAQFGMPEKDIMVYPGEVLSVFGPTGCNKTTLVQNLIMGYDFRHDVIRPEWQLPTLYISLEMSPWYMHRRNLQIAMDFTKDVVSTHSETLVQENKHLLEHIVVQKTAPTVDQIDEKVRDINPRVVIVDHIGLLQSPKYANGEYEHTRQVTKQLSQLALRYDIIVIQVSQISRDYSRVEIVDLYAGKGSGSIENDSRKVLGINGNAKRRDRHVEMFKNTDGEMFEADLLWTPSFRLKWNYEAEATSPPYRPRTQ